MSVREQKRLSIELKISEAAMIWLSGSPYTFLFRYIYKMVYDFNGRAVDYYKDCHIAICIELTTLKILYHILNLLRLFRNNSFFPSHDSVSNSNCVFPWYFSVNYINCVMSLKSDVLGSTQKPMFMPFSLQIAQRENWKKNGWRRQVCQICLERAPSTPWKAWCFYPRSPEPRKLRSKSE